MTTYREEWFEDDDSKSDDDSTDDSSGTPSKDELKSFARPRWQFYADVDKSGSSWTRERIRVWYEGGGPDPCTTYYCDCGGVGHYTSRNICVHRYREEWLTNHYDDPELPDEWEVTYDDR